VAPYDSSANRAARTDAGLALEGRTTAIETSTVQRRWRE
jgi:hypothetical protein